MRYIRQTKVRSAALGASVLLALSAVVAGAGAHGGSGALAGSALFAGDEGPSPVEVVLYGEALCPYCVQFTLKTVAPLLDGDFANVIQFRYVAYGNAHAGSEGPSCQHGPAECRLNRVVNCAQDQAPDQARWFPFVRCLEAADPKGMEEAVEECAADAGLDAAALHECSKPGGARGDELDAAAAKETAALRPPHQWVPWVTVNNITLGEDLDALWRYVCVAYTGERPEACYAPPPSTAAAAVQGSLAVRS